MDNDRLNALAAVMDEIEDSIVLLNKMDTDLGLTETQECALAQLRDVLEHLEADYCRIDKEYLNYPY